VGQARAAGAGPPSEIGEGLNWAAEHFTIIRSGDPQHVVSAALKFVRHANQLGRESRLVVGEKELHDIEPPPTQVFRRTKIRPKKRVRFASDPSTTSSAISRTRAAISFAEKR
jgi:hypothetical protein